MATRSCGRGGPGDAGASFAEELLGLTRVGDKPMAQVAQEMSDRADQISENLPSAQWRQSFTQLGTLADVR